MEETSKYCRPYLFAVSFPKFRSTPALEASNWSSLLPTRYLIGISHWSVSEIQLPIFSRLLFLVKSNTKTAAVEPRQYLVRDSQPEEVVHVLEVSRHLPVLDVVDDLVLDVRHRLQRKPKVSLVYSSETSASRTCPWLAASASMRVLFPTCLSPSTLTLNL